MKVSTFNKHISGLTAKCFEMPNASYTNRYQQAEKRDREYENLLQEKHGIKAHAQIAHLVFCLHLIPTLKNQKSYFLANAQLNKTNRN